MKGIYVYKNLIALDYSALEQRIKIFSFGF